jgi:hypothetical protein
MTVPIQKITLLDYFAGQALQGILANNPNQDSETFVIEAKVSAAIAYKMAQAMIWEREEY